MVAVPIVVPTNAEWREIADTEQWCYLDWAAPAEVLHIEAENWATGRPMLVDFVQLPSQIGGHPYAVRFRRIPANQLRLIADAARSVMVSAASGGADRWWTLPELLETMDSLPTDDAGSGGVVIGSNPQVRLALLGKALAPFPEVFTVRRPRNRPTWSLTQTPSAADLVSLRNLNGTASK